LQTQRLGCWVFWGFEQLSSALGGGAMDLQSMSTFKKLNEPTCKTQSGLFTACLLWIIITRQKKSAMQHNGKSDCKPECVQRSTKVGVISASIPLENYDCCNNCCQIKPVAWSLNPVLTLELIAASFPVIQNLRQTRWNRYTHIYLKLFQHFNWFRLISGCWFHIGCQFLSITSQFCTTTYQWFYEILCQRVKWML